MPVKQCTPALYAFCHSLFPFASSFSRRGPWQHVPGRVALPHTPATRYPPSAVWMTELTHSPAVGAPLESKLLKPRCQATLPFASSLTASTPAPVPVDDSG